MTPKARKIATTAAAGAVLLLAAAAPVRAGWREDIGTFRIGMVAEPGAGQSVAGLPALKKAYSAALGMPVEILVARSLPALVEAQADRRVDYAVYSAAAYATAWRLCGCVEPVAAPVGADGSTAVRAVLLGRAGAAVSLDGIGGQRVAVAAGGPLRPAAGLLEAVAAAGAASPTLVEVASAEEAERLFASGGADLLLGWEPVAADGTAVPDGGTRQRLVLGGIDGTQLSAVWTSPPVRYGPHAVRADLDGEARRLLVAFLVELKDRQPDVYDLIEFHRQGGFVATSHETYRGALDAVGAAVAPRP
jgi:phosphonate transport system substrate-binding protein